MEGVSECVAFDLNVMKIVLKLSEENSNLKKEHTPSAVYPVKWMHL